ncbi:MAG: class III poly(R)-hydroxyalkanoic acid synthase subunit PhaC [Deinococcales bacterium]
MSESQLPQVPQFPLDMVSLSKDMVERSSKLFSGLENLSALREEDIAFGLSPKEEVARIENIVLYRYKALTEKVHNVPVLISYALVNRPYMVDLQEDRSLVKNLLKLGMDVYIIDWGYPRSVDRYRTLEDYICYYLDSFIDIIRERHALDKINLLGICQGGVFSLMYSSLFGDEKIRNLITMVTPVDFIQDDGLLNQWSGCTYGPKSMDVDVMVDALGNVGGDFMNYGYLMLRPFSLGLGKYIGLPDIMGDKDKLTNFLRMERWIFDSPDQAGEAFRQFIKDMYQGNKLIKGQVRLGQHQVNLKNITMPLLNIYAEQDHLVPPASTKALKNYIGSSDYEVHGFPVGHIGMYVSGKVQKDLPPLIANWLKAR